MELNSTWADFQTNLKEIKGDMAGFRGVHAVRKIPLYEVHCHPFYKDYAHLTYNNHTRINIDTWRYAMNHSPHGYYDRAEYYYKDGYQLNDVFTSASMMKCNHHYFHYNYLAKRDIRDFDLIVELGGGCGDMAKFIRNMGYKNKYVIIDLPEVSSIQKYNLHGYNIDLTNEPVDNDLDNVLFISTWGISECPVEWRNEVLNRLKPTNWLIAYQRKFEGIDNEAYFKDFDGARFNFPVLSWDGGSEYILK
jgi:hypothetical protein